MTTLEEEKHAFLDDEFLSSSIAGAFQRCTIYATKTDKDRRAVREELRSALRDLAAEYRSKVSPEKHLINITGLSERMVRECKSLLANGEFRVGVAQKALGLYLKYLWCNGWITDPPPMCPFDSIVITKKKLLGFPDDKWTEERDIGTCKKWAEKAEERRKAAGAESASEWELRAWNAAQRPRKQRCADASGVCLTASPTLRSRDTIDTTHFPVLSHAKQENEVQSKV